MPIQRLDWLHQKEGVLLVILITDEIKAKLLENGARVLNEPDFDPEPVVKFFTPDAGATWLVAAMYPDDQDILYGLCDLGLGYPELGDVSLEELKEIRGKMGLPVERDLGFKSKMTLSGYARLASAERGIRA
jgi:hypothetical protein